MRSGRRGIEPSSDAAFADEGLGCRGRITRLQHYSSRNHTNLIVRAMRVVFLVIEATAVTFAQRAISDSLKRGADLAARNNLQMAEKLLRPIIRGDPGSEDAREAVDILQHLYVTVGKYE